MVVAITFNPGSDDVAFLSVRLYEYQSESEMTPLLSSRDNVRIVIRSIFWFVMALCFLVSAPLLTAWSWLLLAGMVILGFLLAIPAYYIRRLRARKRSGYSARSLYLRFALALSIILIFFSALPVYYFSWQVSVSPHSVPKVILSYGNRKIVFQGMMHIGSESFYKSVAYDVEQAIADGYHVYYEGVKPSPGEGDRFMAEFIGGGKAVNDNYKTIANICGLRFQKDYFRVMEQHAKANPLQVVEADVSSLDLKKEYERLVGTDPAFAAAEGPQAMKAKSASNNDGDFMAALLSVLHDSTAQQKELVGIIGRGIINMAVAESKSGGERDKLILNYRNRYLVDMVSGDGHDKMYILYGAAHIPGVVKLLHQKEPKLKVVSVTWQRSIAAPDRAEGELSGVVVGK